jgi:dimethylargininase
MFTKALLRLPGDNFAEGLTTSDLGKPELSLTIQQHQAYQRALVECGLELHVLPADLDHPDSTFVEDTAIVVNDLAVITRPGASSRLNEAKKIEQELKKFFSRFDHITPPGTLDGGDICEAGNHFFIGISERTNQTGAVQLSEILNQEGFTSELIDIRGIPGLLHLKSGIAYIGNQTLVVANAIAQQASFEGFNLIPVDDHEQYAANCILVNNQILLPGGYPIIQSRLEQAGFKLKLLDMSEFQKMDGGLSCLSLRIC